MGEAGGQLRLRAPPPAGGWISRPTHHELGLVVGVGAHAVCNPSRDLKSLARVDADGSLGPATRVVRAWLVVLVVAAGAVSVDGVGLHDVCVDQETLVLKVSVAELEGNS